VFYFIGWTSTCKEQRVCFYMWSVSASRQKPFPAPFVRPFYFVPARLYLGLHWRKEPTETISSTFCKATLLRAFSALSRLTLEGFSWKFIYRTLHTYARKQCKFSCDPSVTKGTLLEGNVPSRLYLGSPWGDFPENSYLVLPTHALQTMQVWLLSVSN
jgi:hypothetical protein